jgi:hypothetical protein
MIGQLLEASNLELGAVPSWCADSATACRLCGVEGSYLVLDALQLGAVLLILVILGDAMLG